MATPVTVVRSWQYGINRYANEGGALGTANSQQRLLRVIKNLLLGTGQWLDRGGNVIVPTGLWTVSYSSNSVAVGVPGDGDDKWLADANIVWNNVGAAHSWIVLRQTGLILGSTTEICIDCTNSTTTNLTVFISPSAGFTGGTTLNRPTAVDEYAVDNATVWGAGSTFVTANVHAMISADGAATRIFICRANMLQGLWMFEVPTNAVQNWTGPIFSYIAGSTTGVTVATLSATASARPGGQGPSLTTFLAFLTAEGGSSLGLLTDGGNQVPNDFDNTDQFAGVGIYSQTYPARGRPGGLLDMWMYNDENSMGPVGGLIPGAMSFPDDLSRQFNQFGPIVVPWCNRAGQSY